MNSQEIFEQVGTLQVAVQETEARSATLPQTNFESMLKALDVSVLILNPVNLLRHTAKMARFKKS